MKKQKTIEKNIDILILLLFTFPFFGGLNDFHIIFSMDVILVGVLIYKIIKNGFVRYTLDFKFIATLIFVFSYLITSIYSADKTNALLGFFKFATIPIFLFLVMQYDLNKEEKTTLLSTVGVSGSVMVVLSILGMSMGVQDFFVENRLAGFFSYANSFAMWLLMGIIIIGCKEKLKIIDFVMLSILMIGVILTNSRSINIIMVITYLLIFIFNKSGRKELFINGLIMIVVAIITYFILTKFGIFSRIVTGSSGEGLLRILYYKDALRMIKENIFGYGYLSWWYMQPSFQTGVYYSMYMHNSLLQVVFDVGIIPALLVVYIFISGFFDKKANLTERLLMLIILGHAIIDFDIEFLAITMVLFLALNFDKVKISTNVKWLKISFVCVGVLYGYFYLVTLLQNQGDHFTVNQIYPFWSQAQQAEFSSMPNSNKKVTKAYKVQKLNKYYKQTYYTISDYYQAKNDFESAYNYEKQVISIDRYNKSVYLAYIDFIQDAIDYYTNINDAEKVEFYSGELVQVPQIIENVLSTSDSLAFKIEHKPSLDLPEETLQYIEEIKEKNNL